MIGYLFKAVAEKLKKELITDAQIVKLVDLDRGQLENLFAEAKNPTTPQCLVSVENIPYKKSGGRVREGVATINVKTILKTYKGATNNDTLSEIESELNIIHLVELALIGFSDPSSNRAFSAISGVNTSKITTEKVIAYQSTFTCRVIDVWSDKEIGKATATPTVTISSVTEQ